MSAMFSSRGSACLIVLSSRRNTSLGRRCCITRSVNTSSAKIRSTLPGAAACPRADLALSAIAPFMLMARGSCLAVPASGVRPACSNHARAMRRAELHLGLDREQREQRGSFGLIVGLGPPLNDQANRCDCCWNCPRRSPAARNATPIGPNWPPVLPFLRGLGPVAVLTGGSIGPVPQPPVGPAPPVVRCRLSGAVQREPREWASLVARPRRRHAITSAMASSPSVSTRGPAAVTSTSCS